MRSGSFVGVSSPSEAHGLQVWEAGTCHPLGVPRAAKVQAQNPVLSGHLQEDPRLSPDFESIYFLSL